MSHRRLVGKRNLVLLATRDWRLALSARKARRGQSEVRTVALMLGGRRVLHCDVKTPLDAHWLILSGMPTGAASYLVESLPILRKSETLGAAIGMSLRTLQRRRGDPSRPLRRDQGGRVWKLAETISKAVRVFGSQEEAETWFTDPALGLNQNRPIELMTTPAGAKLVNSQLDRLEYGVYV